MPRVVSSLWKLVCFLPARAPSCWSETSKWVMKVGEGVTLGPQLSVFAPGNSVVPSSLRRPVTTGKLLPSDRLTPEGCTQQHILFATLRVAVSRAVPLLVRTVVFLLFLFRVKMAFLDSKATWALKETG